MTINHICCKLRHVLGKLFAAQQVEMDMLYRLATVFADICDNSVTACKTASRRYLGYCLEYRFYIAGVLLIDSICGFDVAFWNDKYVNGSLRSDIIEGIDVFVLVYLCGGDFSLDYFTKQARHHFDLLFL